MPVPLWTRDAFVSGGRDAAVTFTLLSRGPAPSLEGLDADSLGIPPGELPSEMSVDSTDEGDWRAHYLAGELREAAAHDLGALASSLDEARWCHTVSVAASDPSDLRHLQVAWGLARHLLRAGAMALFDDELFVWRSPDEVLGWAPDRAFTLSHEVRIVFEPQRSALGHVVHTRGLGRFGRPDLIVPGLEPDALEPVQRLLSRLSWQLAMGAVFEPGDTLEVDDRPPLVLLTEGASVQLANDALVLRDLLPDGTAGPSIACWLAST